MSEYFPKSKSFGGRMKDELELSNYATKADLKNAIGVDTSKFANFRKNFDIDKLKNVPAGFYFSGIQFI